MALVKARRYASTTTLGSPALRDKRSAASHRESSSGLDSAASTATASAAVGFSERSSISRLYQLARATLTSGASRVSAISRDRRSSALGPSAWAATALTSSAASKRL